MVGWNSAILNGVDEMTRADAEMARSAGLFERQNSAHQLGEKGEEGKNPLAFLE